MPHFSEKKSLRWGLAFLAILVFTVATQQYGKSPFLADQLDQILSFERLMRLETAGFYGPVASGTQVHALGPLGSLFFGIPHSLGLNPDASQILFSLTIVLGTLGFLWVLAALESWLAFLYFALLMLVPAFWWTLWIFWINVLLLPIAFLFFASCLQTLRSREALWPLLGLTFFVLALHIHLATLMAAPFALFLAGELWRRRHDFKTKWRGRLGVAAAWLTLSVTPYVYAELSTYLSNTRNALGHVSDASHRARHIEGFLGGLESVHRQVDPFDIGGPYHFQRNAQRKPFVFALAVAFLCMAIRSGRRSVAAWRRGQSPLWSDFLWASSGVALVSQFVYFWLANRTLADTHYTLFYLPLSLAPYALMAHAIFKRMAPGTRGLALASLGTVTFIRGVFLSSSVVPPIPWTYQASLDALRTICHEHPAVRTFEKFPFVTYTPEIDPGLLQFLIQRYSTGCILDPAATTILVPGSQSDPVKLDAETLVFKKLMQPGIGIYELVGGAK